MKRSIRDEIVSQHTNSNADIQSQVSRAQSSYSKKRNHKTAYGVPANLENEIDDKASQLT